jgi:anti-sigma28 factor (negative regulator of flagellin synthesis)
VLDINRWISMSTLDDVRWDKVERVKLVLASGTYPIPPERVGEKLVEHMLKLDDAHHRRKRSRSGSKTNDDSGVGDATSAARQHDTGDRKVNKRRQARVQTMKSKVTCAGKLCGYMVTGWRYLEDNSWHVKVSQRGHSNGWIGYTVTAGRFELNVAAQGHKEAVLQLISEWEAELGNLSDQAWQLPRHGLQSTSLGCASTLAEMT